MTQKPRQGDRVRLVMAGTVTRITDHTMTLQPDHTPAGELCTVDLAGNLLITEIIERAQLDAAQAVVGDRISNSEDDWGTVIFNDAHGEQLLVAYDQLYGRALVAYDRVRIVRRPSDLVQGYYDRAPGDRVVVEGVDFGDACEAIIPGGWQDALNRALERQQEAQKRAMHEAHEAEAKARAVPSATRRFMPRGFA